MTDFLTSPFIPSSIRRRFHTRRPSRQAVVTRARPCPLRNVASLISCIGYIQHLHCLSIIIEYWYLVHRPRKNSKTSNSCDNKRGGGSSPTCDGVQLLLTAAYSTKLPPPPPTSPNTNTKNTKNKNKNNHRNNSSNNNNNNRATTSNNRGGVHLLATAFNFRPPLHVRPSIANIPRE